MRLEPPPTFYTADIGQNPLLAITHPSCSTVFISRNLGMFDSAEKAAEGSKYLARAVKGPLSGLACWWTSSETQRRLIRPAVSKMFIRG